MSRRALKFTLYWVGGLLITGGIVLLTGIPLLPVLTCILCLIMMLLIYGESRDLFDLRAAFFLATFVFVAAPSVYYSISFGPDDLWRSPDIERLIISRSDFDLAQRVIFFGLLAVTLPILVHLARAVPSPSMIASERTPSRLIWLVYFTILVTYLGLTVRQYGGPASILLYATDPIARLQKSQDGQLLSGLSALLAFGAEVCAYYASRRLRPRLLSIVLFLPILPGLLTEGSRGVLLIWALVALVAVVDLRVRTPFLVIIAGYALLPLVASRLVHLRDLSVQAGQSRPGLADQYRQFQMDSNMVAMMAMALRGLRDGVIDYSYGIDLLSLPGWYIPRAIWTGKPLPLDFRLNAALGLNDGDVFGSPVTIFGGIYLNFTPVFYLFAFLLFALLLIYAYRWLRQDRLLTVFFFVFVMDIVRVGDLSREMVTFSLSLVATLAVRWVVVPRGDVRIGAAARDRRVVAQPLHPIRAHEEILR